MRSSGRFARILVHIAKSYRLLFLFLEKLKFEKDIFVFVCESETFGKQKVCSYLGSCVGDAVNRAA
jgi:hypothetical protein